jgi:hypothetical protein
LPAAAAFPPHRNSASSSVQHATCRTNAPTPLPIEPNDVRACHQRS